MDTSRVLREAAGLCPICSKRMRLDCSSREILARCPACRKPVWFLSQVEGNAVVLHFLPSYVTRMESRERFNDVLRVVDSASAIVVDLDCLESVTSSFLSMLVALRKHVESSGQKLRICGVQGQTEEAFWRTFFTRLFEICEDEEGALASLSS